MYMIPSEIRYSQDSIACCFSYGSHSGRPIGETLDDLLHGLCTDDDIPMMTVTSRKGHWYTGDNRRLWVFQKAEELGIIFTVEVKKGYVNPNKFTTDNDGVSIEIRGNPGGRAWRKRRRPKKKNVICDPSPPKMVNPPMSVYSLPPLRFEPKREDIHLSPQNVVPVVIRDSKVNDYNNYLREKTTNCNELHHDLPSVRNADSYTMPEGSMVGHDNLAFVRGENDTQRMFGNGDDDVLSSDVKCPSTVGADPSTVGADVNTLTENVKPSPGVSLPSANGDIVDQPTSVDAVKERSDVMTTESTTTVDVEAGETVPHSRCRYLTSHKYKVIGAVAVSLVILAVVLAVVFAFS